MTATTENPKSDTKPAATKYAVPKGPYLSQLGGMAEARAWGEALVLTLAEYYAGRIKWSDVDPGCVLHGPPGTGKTTYAKALAATAKLPLIMATVGEWQGADGGHLGTLIRAMHNSFEAAKAVRPCILFMDELDSIPARGASEQKAGYWNQFTNALLKALDDLAESPGVIVIGACNHPDLLDPAIIRSGRMDRMIEIALPTPIEIEKILKFHLTVAEQRSVAGPLNTSAFRTIAQLCVGMSGADVAKAVREARTRARVQKHELSAADFAEVLDPPAKRADRQTQWRIAVHEAGHAVAAYRLIKGCQTNLSIVPRQDSMGSVQLTSPDRPTTRKTIENNIVFLLAGRAAEDVFLDEISAGAGGNASSDLAKATNLAIDAVTKLGLSEGDKLIWLGHAERKPLSEYPTEVVDEVTGILKDAYESAVALIQDDWDFVNSVALALVKRRALSHAEFVVIDRRPKAQHPFVRQQFEDIFKQTFGHLMQRKA